MKTFTVAKSEFDTKYGESKTFDAFLPVNQETNKKVTIKNNQGKRNEEFYKWQFLSSIVNSGMYAKDYIGTEIHFPKGNKTSAPIKFDAAIFDSVEWFEHYKNFHNKKEQSSLDWLRKHLICVIEFKKENSKDIETVWNQQLKPALKESEQDFCLGIIYDTERLYLFKKQINYFLRLDESFNLKKEQSNTKDLSLHLTDAYSKTPNFDQLKNKILNPRIDRSQRTLDDLEIITGVFSNQINNSISDILKSLDKVSLLDQRGYEMIIQMIALKIFDEKKSEWLKYFIQDFEFDDIKKLKFYIQPEERDYRTLNDQNIINFKNRIEQLDKLAQHTYKEILSKSIIDWRNEGHVAVIGTIVNSLQDFSFTRSSNNDIYQLVFYKFANAFAKSDKAQFLTPLPLIEFLVRIINPKQYETIIDPTIGTGDFLSISYVLSKGKISDENIFGIDNDRQMIMLAQLNMLLNGDGNAKIKFQPSEGSILYKFDNNNDLISLIPSLHKNGEWDKWSNDYTSLKKFNVVLTNPPFGEDRKFEPKTQREKEIAELYELWNIARNGKWIDLGLIFLENAYRVLEENGRLGIVLSNSLTSIDRWQKAREWLLSKMRIVASFDLPANVFAETGVNTTLIVAYKPKLKELENLKKSNYEIFFKNIKNVGYQIRTNKRVKIFEPLYKVNYNSFDIEIDEEGRPVLEEDFTSTILEFQDWCTSQESNLKKLFVG
ncbi:hypothetical protein MASR1M45_28290 [Candidatus Kapaibacterium sp.]